MESAMPGATPSSDEAGRILGRELVAEARLAYIEVRLSAERSRQRKVELKGELSDARREHAQAYQEADACRSKLTARNAGEPPYQLRTDERSYLTFVAPYVAEPLRERIGSEVARAEIVHDHDEVVVRQPEEFVPREEVNLPGKAKAEPRPAMEKRLSPPAVEDTKHNEYEREEKVLEGFLSPTPPPLLSPPISPTNVTKAQTLPDKEAVYLIVNLELARARIIFLRSEDRNLAAMPHRWISPMIGMSLRGVEEKI